MKRIHTLIITLICMAAFAASSFVSLSYGAELPGKAKEEAFDSYYVPGTQTDSEVSNLRTSVSGKCGKNLSWILDDEWKLTISGTGEMWDYSEDGSGSPWNEYRSSVKTVVIKSGVTSIGEWAFVAFDSLHNITIPSSVTSIGEYAFQNCDSLQNITIPAGVTDIGKWAFFSCDSLQSITIPAGVTHIREGTFYSCTNLQSITIPVSVTSIGKLAFRNCDNLQTVYYNGSESAWENITDFDNNRPLDSVEKLYKTFATGVLLSKDRLTLAPGETFALSAEVMPWTDITEKLEMFFEKPFIWSSADPKIAKVDDNGTVTAVAIGETKVAAMSAAWGYSAYCSVVVKEGGNDNSSGRTKPANTFVGGQKVDIKTLYFSTHPEVTRFQSSSKKTASVNKKGIMKAKKPGIVTIEAQTGKKKAERKTVSSCSLTILEKPKLKFKVKYSASTDIGKVLDGYEFFTTASTRQTAADLWESSKPAIAEINPETGVITIKGKGTTTITAYFGKKGEKGTLKVKAKLKVKK